MVVGVLRGGGGSRGEVSERANKSIETYFVGDKVIISSAGRDE